ncbi:MAG: flagellin [Pseudomonadota bacterium]
MTLTVNTNVLSLNAQRNLQSSAGLLGQALERLSSGLRINSAKDDAAGLAIAERLTTQIRGLNQAVRNANDGISLSQTTEGALSEVVSNLQRIRELAVQSANGTNSAEDRAALDSEVQQRLQEIDRIAQQTTFNGLNVLDGTFGTATFQVGPEVGDNIALDLSASARINSLGRIAQETGGAAVDANAIAAGDVTINGVEVASSTDFAGIAAGQEADSAYAKANAINSSGISGVTAVAVSATVAADNAGGVVLVDAADTYTFEINGVTVINEAGAVTLTLEDVIETINGVTGQTGVTATNNGGTIELTAEDGRNITTEATLVDANTNATVFFDDDAGTAAVARGSIQLTSPVGAIAVVDGNNRTGVGSTTIQLDNSSLIDVDVTTVGNAENTLNRVDAALDVINNTRGDLGAVQNRLESTIINLSNVVVNLEASRGRITDADFAAETAKLTRAQILQQAGISVASQANAAPQSVLGLLQG